MSHAHNAASWRADIGCPPYDSDEASLSLSDDAPLTSGGPTPSHPTSIRTSDVALPSVLSASSQTTLPSTVKASRLATAVQRRNSNVSTSFSQTAPLPLMQDVYSDMLPHNSPECPLPIAKQAFVSREDLEAASLLSTRTRGGEMSSFGISVSVATGAATCSVSTMPTRWLKSADLRSLGVGSDISPPSMSPHVRGSSVFERYVQIPVTHTAAEENAMMHAAEFFAASFD